MTRKSFFRTLAVLAASPAVVARVIAAAVEPTPKIFPASPWSGIKFDPALYQGELTWVQNSAVYSEPTKTRPSSRILTGDELEEVNAIFRAFEKDRALHEKAKREIRSAIERRVI